MAAQQQRQQYSLTSPLTTPLTLENLDEGVTWVSPTVTDGIPVEFKVKKLSKSDGYGYSNEVNVSLNGAIVDDRCPEGPDNAKPGEFFSAPLPGNAVVAHCRIGEGNTNCGGLLSMERLATQGDMEEWMERVSVYANYPSAIPLSSVWICGTTAAWYGSVPGFKKHGTGPVGFAATAPLQESIYSGGYISLSEYVIAGKSSSPLGLFSRMYNAISNWASTVSWDEAAERFNDLSGVREMLMELAMSTGGVVPSYVGAGSIAVIPRVGKSLALLLPIPASPVRIEFPEMESAIESWVSETMRAIWMEIVADVQQARSAFSPTSFVPNPKTSASLANMGFGFVVGAVSYHITDFLPTYIGDLFPRSIL